MRGAHLIAARNQKEREVLRSQPRDSSLQAGPTFCAFTTAQSCDQILTAGMKGEPLGPKGMALSTAVLETNFHHTDYSR